MAPTPDGVPFSRSGIRRFDLPGGFGYIPCREYSCLLMTNPGVNIPYGKITDVRQIGAAIRHKRRAIGMRQAELAALSGVGPRFLSELENGKPTAEIGKALRVLQRLGLDLRIEPRSTGATTEQP